MNATVPTRRHGRARSSRAGRLGAALVAAVIAVSLLSGCGSSTSSSSPASSAAPASTASSSGSAAADCRTPPGQDVHFAKTKFVLHAGLAFGAFHRYLYKPFRAGTFHHFAHGRIRAIIKAGLAVLFIHHELLLAAADARSDPTLSKLAAPFEALDANIRALGSSVTHGAGNANATNASLEALRQQSGASGATITDQETATLPVACAA